MNIPLGAEGRVLNSSLSGHVVRVEDDSGNTGGFLVYERWDGSDGPNANGEFDDWVENEASLERYFAEAGWEVEWTVT